MRHKRTLTAIILTGSLLLVGCGRQGLPRPKFLRKTPMQIDLEKEQKKMKKDEAMSNEKNGRKEKPEPAVDAEVKTVPGHPNIVIPVLPSSAAPEGEAKTSGDAKAAASIQEKSAPASVAASSVKSQDLEQTLKE